MKDMIGNVGILLTLLQWLHSIQADQKAIGETVTIRDYLEWLRRHNHQELVAALEVSHEAQAQLDQLIREKHDALIQMSDRIVETMTSNQQVLLSEFAEVKATLKHILEGVVVLEVDTPPPLSGEAVEILRAAVTNKTDLWVVDEMDITMVHVETPAGEKINFEGNFYVEAATELANRDFIRHRGGLVWTPTRAGYVYVASTKETVA